MWYWLSCTGGTGQKQWATVLHCLDGDFLIMTVQYAWNIIQNISLGILDFQGNHTGVAELVLGCKHVIGTHLAADKVPIQ